VAAVLAALAAGRRLGPPVEEPLPVRPRAGETALGRGRLYRRARARRAALDAIRGTALDRLRTGLQVAPEAGPDALVTAVAQRTGQPPAAVSAVLEPATPDNDSQLVAAVAALDALVDRALPAGTREHATHVEGHALPKERP
jgi:hypothetical protein